MFRPLLKDRSKHSSLCLLTGAVSLFFAAAWVSAKFTGGNLLDIGVLVAAALGITAVAWSCYRHCKLLRLKILELRAQNLQLDRAVNNITQALVVFDGQANLVLCNERYRQMYGLCPEMVRPELRCAACSCTGRSWEISQATLTGTMQRFWPISRPERPPPRQ